MSSLVKYGSVFNTGLQNTFVYRWNFLLRSLFGLVPLAGTVLGLGNRSASVAVFVLGASGTWWGSKPGAEDHHATLF